MKYCKYFGQQIHTDAVFCKYCGCEQSMRQVKKGSKKKKLIMSAVAIVLVAALAVTTFWKPGFFWKFKYRNVTDDMVSSADDLPDDESDMLFKDAAEDPVLKAMAEDYTSYSPGSSIRWTEQEIAAGKVYHSVVSPDEPSAVLSGITVDIGACDIAGNSTLSVRIPESKSSADESCRNATLYDLSLIQNSEVSGDIPIESFAEPVRIEIPYTASDDTFPMVQYYDAENNGWELIPSEQTGTGLEFYVTHFSPYVVFEYEIPSYDHLTPDLKINLDANKIIQSAQVKDYQKAFMDFVQGDQGELKAQYKDIIADQTNTCVSVGGLPVSLADLMKSGSFASLSGNILGGIGVLCTTYLFVREIQATKSIPEQMDVLLKRGFDLGAAFSTTVSIGSTAAAYLFPAKAAIAATVGAVASIAAVFFTIAGLMNTIHQMQMSATYGGYEDGAELAYRTFSQKLSFDPQKGCFFINLNHYEHTSLDYWSNNYISFKSCCFEDKAGMYFTGKLYNLPPADRMYTNSSASWAQVMNYCKKTYGLENAVKNYEKYVDLYCRFFWSQSPAVKNAFFKFGYHEVPGNGRTAEIYNEPFYNDSYVRRMKDEIMKTSEPLIEGVLKEMVLDIRAKTHAAYQNYVNEVNSEISFVLDYRDKEGNPLSLADSPYKDSYIVVGIDDTRWNRGSTPAWEVDKTQQKLFTCTFAAYSLSQPVEKNLDQLQVFKNEEEYLQGKAPIAVIPFSLQMPVTTVRMNAGDIFGTWNVSTDVGEFGSAMTDQQVNSYIETMKELARSGAAGVDMNGIEEYLRVYEESMRKALGNHSGTMVITDAGEGRITAVITYSDAADHPSRYSGTYDPQSRVVILKNDDTQALDPGLQFTVDPGPPMRFSTEVSYNSEIADYRYTMSGVKAD